MEDVGTRGASPIFIHQSLSMAKKRDLLYQNPNYQHQHQQQRFQSSTNNWNPKVWDWDSVTFAAKPVETADGLHLGTAPSFQSQQKKKEEDAQIAMAFKKTSDGEDDESLMLKLGGGPNSVEEPISRPNKRVRSGSPGGSSYPICQVDDCKEDLSSAKDYHRRHKVCEAHSKSTKALVGTQMQRFCQQCSRFHPLSEFDEGKRSCRRRLAGHNRRRRKTQPEDVTSRLLVPANNQNNAPNGNLDLVNLLTVLARAQGNNGEKIANCSSIPEKDHIIQILSKINSLPLPLDFASKLTNLGSSDNNVAEQAAALEHQNRLNGKTTSPSTMDLLAALPSTLHAASRDALDIPAKRSSESEKTRQICSNLQQKPIHQDIPSSNGGESSTSYQSPIEDSDCQIVQETTGPNLPLQLFSPSPESDGPPKVPSSRKYFSSDSSNPTAEERSPSSSPPVVQNLFPMHSATATMEHERMSMSGENAANVEASKMNGRRTPPLELFNGIKKGGVENGLFQSLQHQAEYTSSSGSDHSPSSFNSDARDRTGRIIFKLFDKDPSHLPGTLRTQIFNWLSHSPSEMESYIRPGCVVLSIYMAMPSAAWKQLEDNLVHRLMSLVHHSDSDFWRNGRFLLNTGRKFASHKDGKVRVCKPWSARNSPELISVSPFAIVAGQETSLLLRGRNLTSPGTRIHCAYMGGYTSTEVPGSASHGAIYEVISLGSFKLGSEAPSVLGRCFIEVENGFKSNSFPLIIANAAICAELKLLESEFDEEMKLCDSNPGDQIHDSGQPRSREDIVYFLNELGWLFQRKRVGTNCTFSRFKFLLTFSVERGCCALVKTLLHIILEGNSGSEEGLPEEFAEALHENHLLSRAVKKRCREMVDLLIHYSIKGSKKKYVFLPNHEGPGGITPLHLAACMSDSDNLVEALTSDPLEIGLNCWNSIVDANGQTPYAYALMTNNHSYNSLVARKLADRRNGQISVSIASQIEKSQSREMVTSEPHTQINKQGGRSCARCAMKSSNYSSRRYPGSRGLFHRPYLNSMLAVAAVCVCVCLFMRGHPDTGLVSFDWKKLPYGSC